MTRNIAITTIKNKVVFSSKVSNLESLSLEIEKMKLDNIERFLLTYLDGLVLNTVFPLPEKEIKSIIQSVTSEFDYHEQRQKMLEQR
jgi:hypothetical protein